MILIKICCLKILIKIKFIQLLTVFFKKMKRIKDKTSKLKNSEFEN